MRTHIVLVAGTADAAAQIRTRELLDRLCFDYVFFAKTVPTLALAMLATIDEKASQVRGVEALGHDTIEQILIQEGVADNAVVAKYLDNPHIRAEMEAYSTQALAALQEVLPPPSDHDDMVLVVVPSAPLAGALAHAWATRSNNTDKILGVPRMQFKPGQGFIAMFFDNGSLISLEVPE